MLRIRGWLPVVVTEWRLGTALSRFVGIFSAHNDDCYGFVMAAGLRGTDSLSIDCWVMSATINRI
jgi:hypothetical protein